MSLLGRLKASFCVRPTIKGGVSVLQSCCFMAVCTSGCIAMGWTDTFVKRIPLRPTPPSDDRRPTERLLFLRVLIVPGLCEEVIWRVLLQPPGSSIAYIVWINSMYALSHVLYAPLLWCVAPYWRRARSGHASLEAPLVFSDPTFVSLAFVLGNLCSYSYIRAGYAVWAPVLVHAVTVTVWLSLFGGNEALGRHV